MNEQLKEELIEFGLVLLSLAIIAVMCVSAAYAEPIDELKEYDKYLWNNINYTFKESVSSPKLFLKTMNGDCSEVALAMCDKARKLNVSCHLVYGYVWKNNTKYYHDWAEFKINNTWVNFEKPYYEKIKPRGFGQW